MSEQLLNDRYALESELGRGGMGIVYRGTDTQLNRSVAVKVLPKESSHDHQFTERFRREILNSAKLSHPNIVQVFDVGQDDGTNYYVMQLIDGSDLRTKIQGHGPYSAEETAEILSQVAGALDYAHEQGIVHRDIKPDNILIDNQGVARVVDFGIAKTVEGTKLTGGMIGTPEYMSPEQARGEALDGRSDQYSLAIVAYEMLTGTTPFRSDTAQPWALVNMHATTPPPDPRQFAGDLPENVVNTLLQALEKLPSQRFATCKQFVEAIRGKVKANRQATPTNAATIVQPVSPKVKPVPTRTSPLLPAMLGIVVVVLLIGGGLVLSGAFAPKERVQVEICKESNLIAKADCPRTKTVTFDKGKEPQEECNIDHQPAPEPTPTTATNEGGDADLQSSPATQSSDAVIVGLGVRVRSEPSTGSTIIAQKTMAPTRGMHVTVLEEKNAWYHITYTIHGRQVDGWSFAGLIDCAAYKWRPRKFGSEWCAVSEADNIAVDADGKVTNRP